MYINGLCFKTLGCYSET